MYYMSITLLKKKTGPSEQLSLEAVIVPTFISYLDCMKLSILKRLVAYQPELNRKTWKC